MTDVNLKPEACNDVDKPEAPAADVQKLSAEDAAALIKAIEDVEREEANAMDAPKA